MQKIKKQVLFLQKSIILAAEKYKGALAHLARALRWQRRGDQFESDMLHKKGYFKK